MRVVTNKKRVAKKTDVPATWGVVIYTLRDENDRVRSCYISNESKGSFEEKAAASRNDFINHTNRPDGSKRRYKPREVKVLDVVKFPVALLNVVSEAILITPKERLASVLRVIVAVVGPVGSEGSEQFSYGKGW